MNSVFIACAMGELSPGEREKDLYFITRLTSILEGTTSLGRVFAAFAQFPTPDTYLPPRRSLDLILSQMVQARFSIFYLPRKVYSGALVELGYSLAWGKPTFVITEKKENLPYMFREGADMMRIFEIDDRSADLNVDVFVRYFLEANNLSRGL